MKIFAGPRRCGKTTWLLEQAREAHKDGHGCVVATPLEREASRLNDIFQAEGIWPGVFAAHIEALENPDTLAYYHSRNRKLFCDEFNAEKGAKGIKYEAVTIYTPYVPVISNELKAHYEYLQPHCDKLSTKEVLYKEIPCTKHQG